MKKLNFTQVPCQDIEGNVFHKDISKELGNDIYQKTADLGELELAKKIYFSGEVEMSEEEIEIVRNYINAGFKAFVKVAFEQMVSEAEETDETNV